MRSDLDPIKNKRLSLLGSHQLTLTGICWSGIPTDAEYAAACALSGVIHRVEAWLEGDLLVELVRRQTDLHPGTSPRSLLAEHAYRQARPFDQGYERYLVALNYPLEERASSLTWSHHRICLAHGGSTLREQLKWLHKAQANQWSVRELSAAIMAKQLTLDIPIRPTFPPDLQAAVDYVSAHTDDIAKFTPPQAAQIARELEPVVTYHAKCKERAAT